ncbi:MAG: tetratricopeptide repeat protein, partial [Lacibacter sp.]
MILIALLLVTTQIAYGQDCNTRAANKPSQSVRFQDDYMRSFEDSKANISITKMKPQLAIAENWVKGVLKNFKGAKLAYSNDYFFDYSSGFTKEFYNATGIKGCYSSKMRFYAYYCYENRNEIFTEGESGSFAAVHFNNVFNTSLCTDVGAFTINGKYAFKMFEKSRTEGRIDYYEQIAMSNVYDTIYKSKHDFIIIRNSDLPVFLAVTRKEFLQQLLKDVDAYKSRQTAFAKEAYTPAAEAANKANLDDQLKRIDNSKTSTPEQMAPYRKRLIETWETEKQKFDKRIARIELDTKETKEVLKEYLNKPQEWLNRTVSQFYNFSSYSRRGMEEFLDRLDVFAFSKEDETRTYLATINPAYFNKSLSAEVPQLITVHLPKGTYPHMKKVADLIKRPGALAPLEAILNSGKSPSQFVVLHEKISTYTLKYLPKLTTLTPLPVPADMKPSATPVVPDYNRNVPAPKFNFTIPALSPKLIQLPQLLTTETYKTYVQQLYTAISNAVKPTDKKKADDYVKNKNLIQSKEIGNTAFAAWLQNVPKTSLYLYSKAVELNPSDALAANNFSAFLIMGGLPEKSIPILEYWNKQKPGEAAILSNLGNAYYRLGDVDKAMKYLQQCLQKDSLHPTANKILCLMYLKKGDTKKAKDHGTKSLTTSHDEQVVAILRQLDNKTKPGEIMSRLLGNEFPMLKRIKLPAMPSNLDDMEQFQIDLEMEKKSLEITIANIESKTPKVNDDVKQKILMASFMKGISPLRVKAQHIIMDGMQTYQIESTRESDVFKYNLKKLTAPYNLKLQAIAKKYAALLNKLEGGEAGDEDEIAALELAKCREINAEKEKYLAGLSPLVNGYVQRKEFIVRKFYRDYANWAPYWVPETTISFPSIERDYLKDISTILSEYKMVMKSDCSSFEPLAMKDGILKEWEDEYCANFKGKLGIGPAKITWTCNSWGIEGGEGIVGEIEMNFADDGTFEEFTIGAGLGETWSIGDDKIVKMEASGSIKEFIKIGPDKTSGKWGVKDFGMKSEATLEGSIGNIGGEIKILELSVAVNAGLDAGGVAAPLFN